MIQPLSGRLGAGARWGLAGAALGAALVLSLAATTNAFDPDPPDSAYEAGFDAGFAEAALIDDATAAAIEADWFARGIASPRPASDLTEVQAVRLAALYVVTAAQAPDAIREYEAGFAAGAADARAGTPARFATP